MLIRWRIRPAELLLLLLLGVVTGVIFGIAVYRQIFDVAASDYVQHIAFAQALHDSNALPDTHVMFQLLTIALATALPTSYPVAGWIAATAFYIFTVYILYALVRSVLNSGRWHLCVLSAYGALALLLVTPLTILKPPDHLYFGYMTINVLHSPTMVMLKPFALLLFVFALAILNRTRRLSLPTLIMGVLLVLLSAVAKPNFVLILLPAVLVILGYRLLRRDRAGFMAALLTLVIPLIIVLALQYVITYLFLDTSTHIIFAPLASLHEWMGDDGELASRFVLSIAFPVLVYLLYWRQAVRDLGMNLAGLIFLAGTAHMYLFAESGTHLAFGNFWWSGQIGLFIFFVVATLFWLRNFKRAPRFRAWVCLVVFLLCLLSGVNFYVFEVQASQWMSGW